MSRTLEEPVVVEIGQRSIEALAAALADRLLTPATGAGTRRMPLITARELAALLGCKVAWVRNHQAELGVIRVGDGPRPRLLFDAKMAGDRLASCSASRQSRAPEPPVDRSPRPKPRRSRLGTNIDLLPIRGAKPATRRRREPGK